jgi:hypothetical protein
MSEKTYLVVRRAWYVDDYTAPRDKLMSDLECAFSDVPVAAFADRESAERACRELERKGRREVGSPARFEAWQYGIDTPGRDDPAVRLMELGVEPPEPIESPYGPYFDWLGWWDVVSPSLTEEQRDALWDLAAKVRLYEVRELELGD